MSGVLIQAGTFWCPSCFGRSEFVVAEDASPDDPECDLECYTCGYIYGQIVEEFDPETGEVFDHPRKRNAIGREAREQARRELRERFRVTVIRDGVRLENFKRGKRSGYE